MKKIIALIIFLAVFNLMPDISYAQPASPMWERCQPTYGEYCCSHKWGWYGAKRAVNTVNEAREIVVSFFAPYGNLRVGAIREKPGFFEAEILDRNGTVVDLVIIHKKSGRIRSIF